MASDTWYLWAFSYAIGEKGYTCPLYFKNREQAEAQIHQILDTSKHIRKLDLQECKDGLQFGNRYLPYRRGKEEIYRG